MPPQIALLIYSSIVICLLVIEHKQTYDSSKIIWIPTFWMLIIASKPLGVWFNSNIEGSIEEGSSIDRTFLLILLFLGLLILVRRRFNLSLVVKENFWIIFLLSYMFVSIMWSDIPFISFKRWIRELLALVMAFIVSTETNPIKSLESIIRKTVYILIPFSICLIDYFPLYGRMYNRWSGDLMWIGVTMHKNSLGRLCLIAIFFIFLTLIKYWKIRIATNKKYQNYADLFIIILAIWLLKGPPGSYSATATIALLLGILSFIFGSSQ